MQTMGGPAAAANADDDDDDDDETRGSCDWLRPTSCDTHTRIRQGRRSSGRAQFPTTPPVQTGAADVSLILTASVL